MGGIAEIPEEAFENGLNHAVSGLSASNSDHIIFGDAYILLDFSRASEFISGSILVTHQTSPECTVAIEDAIAVVTQRGGILCHAAIVCRDLGIPCVVGVPNITDIIKHGQKIGVCTKTSRIFF